MVKNRLKEVLGEKGDTINMLSKRCNFPQRTLNRQINEATAIGYDVLSLFAEAYPDLNMDWVVTGEGEMLKLDKSVSIFLPENLPKQIGKLFLAPIYESYPVSAGNMGLSAVRDDKPDGYAYTTMPGVTFFPVVGCSFEPTIKAGDYIGAVKVDSWDRVDTEKIYFILTREERMIKRLRVDNNDNNILWCVSPNFHEFKIMKQDVIEISHVFFHGMMV